ncbi:MAG: dockerin type I repeat-containing protein [bacterium]
MLQVELERELSEFGTSLRDTTPRIPTGADNCFMYCEEYSRNRKALKDPAPVVSKILVYEQLIGDYDANGEVNAADLVPVARYLGSQVQYLDTDLFDSDYQQPFQQNLEIQRADGNNDGEINLADISVIAQHWMERVDGIRIHRSVNGGPEELLPDYKNPGNPLTISRSTDYPDYVGDPEELVAFDYVFEQPGRYPAYEYNAWSDGVEGTTVFRVEFVNLAVPEPGPSRDVAVEFSRQPELGWEYSLDEEAAPCFLTLDLSSTQLFNTYSNGNFFIQLLDAEGTIVKQTPWIDKVQAGYLIPIYNSGSYTVRLEVQDASTAADRGEFSFELAGTSLAMDDGWSMHSTGLQETLPLPYSVQLDLAEVDDRPALLHLQRSQEPGGDLNYVIATDAAGHNWPAARIVTPDLPVYDWAGPDPWGSYFIPAYLLKLMERDGQPLVMVMASNDYNLQDGQCMLAQADSAEGAAFNLTTQFAALTSSSIRVTDNGLWIKHIPDFVNSGKLLFASDPADFDFVQHVLPQDDSLTFNEEHLQLAVIHGRPVLFELPREGSMKLYEALDEAGSQWADPVMLEGLSGGFNPNVLLQSDRIVLQNMLYANGSNQSAPANDKYRRIYTIDVIRHDGSDWSVSSSHHDFRLLDYKEPQTKATVFRNLDDGNQLAAFDDGLPMLFYTTESGDIRYLRCKDPLGTAIEVPTIVTAASSPGGLIPLRACTVNGKAALVSVDSESGELLYIPQG